MVPWLLMAIIIVLIILGLVVWFVRKDNKRPTDYYNLFVIGIIWVAIGLPLDNMPLFIVGLALMISGLANKDKWKQNRVKLSDLNEKERKYRMYLIIFASVLVLVGVVVFLLVVRCPTCLG
ncbi:hypothetical protein ACFL1B_00465 [Nanoarchaeota archaeon]